MFACAIVACILHYNSMRNRSSLHRKAVLPPSQSPWAYLYRNADNLSFLHLTGMSRQAFEKMKDILFDEEIESLHIFAGWTMKLKWICIQFGIIESTASEAVSKMVELVRRKLKNRLESRISFPIEEGTALRAEMVMSLFCISCLAFSMDKF